MTRPPATQRVVHVIDSLGLSGGAEQQMAVNLRRFSDRRLEHHVICLYTAEGRTRSSELPAHIPIRILFPTGERTRNRLKLILRLYGVIRVMRPALIHCTLPDASLAARISGILRNVPVIESLVNISHEPVRQIDNPRVTGTKLALHRLVDRLTIRSVEHFHVLSEAVATSWAGAVGIPRERMTVIPRGLEIRGSSLGRAWTRSELLEDLGLPGDSFVILNVGRQVAQKGQLYALRALPSILKRVPRAVFLSAGSEGGMTMSLRAESERLGLADRAIWLGVRDDIRSLMPAADVFVFPSLYEGLGVSLLEAMAAGLAVVVTDVPPMNELVEQGKTGMLVPPRDPEAIARAVRTLAMDEDLRRALGNLARAHVIANFDAEDTARRLEALYLDVLGFSTRADPEGVGSVDD